MTKEDMQRKVNQLTQHLLSKARSKGYDLTPEICKGLSLVSVGIVCSNKQAFMELEALKQKNKQLRAVLCTITRTPPLQHSNFEPSVAKAFVAGGLLTAGVIKLLSIFDNRKRQQRRR